MLLMQGTRRLLLFHLGTNQAFREAIVRAESAIFLQRFAAGVHQLSGCPDTTMSVPSALSPRAPIVLFWYHRLAGSRCAAFLQGR